ncbi:MAG: hypothetical protein FWH29_04540 [Methanobrevibacter sp.]|nr:hypothetical protein [Methanobrevibacter sp.]
MVNSLKKFIKTTNKIIVDSNLFLLYLAGLHDINTIKKIKSTKIFSKKEFKILQCILNNYKEITTTLHILTEFSNLNKDKYNKKNDFYRKELFGVLQLLLEEEYLHKNSLIFLN